MCWPRHFSVLHECSTHTLGMWLSHLCQSTWTKRFDKFIDILLSSKRLTLNHGIVFAMTTTTSAPFCTKYSCKFNLLTLQPQPYFSFPCFLVQCHKNVFAWNCLVKLSSKTLTLAQNTNNSRRLLAPFRFDFLFTAKNINNIIHKLHKYVHCYGQKENILHLKNKQFDFLSILNTPEPKNVTNSSPKKRWQKTHWINCW